MGKSKATKFQTLDDGGYVPRQHPLHGKAIQEARLAEERKKWDRQYKEYLAKERERAITEARRVKALEEALEKERKRKEEEYNKPLPEFEPRIPQEVRGKFFQYVARVVSDALWNLEHQFGEEIPPPKPPRKKMFAESLKAALRISTLKMDGLAARVYIFVDMSHSCFNETDRVLLGAYSYLEGDHFDRRVEYRIKCNLFKNIPYFASFDPERQKNANPRVRIIEWDVHRERDGDFAILKKSGFCYPGEDHVVHLEIF